MPQRGRRYHLLAADTLRHLGLLYHTQGQLSRAERAYADATELAVALGDRHRQALLDPGALLKYFTIGVTLAANAFLSDLAAHNPQLSSIMFPILHQHRGEHP